MGGPGIGGPGLGWTFVFGAVFGIVVGYIGSIAESMVTIVGATVFKMGRWKTRQV